MQQQIYPLTPVIFNHPQFMEAYNAHPDSATRMTACLTPEDFDLLISQNLVFDKVVLVNGQGNELVGKLGDIDTWDDEFMPKIESFEFHGSIADAISNLHELIEGDPMEYGMG